MKRHIFILSIYPSIALFLLVSTWVLFGDWWRISVLGDETDGRIEAMFFLRDEGPNALLSGVDTELRLTRANGSVLELFYRDNVLKEAREGTEHFPVREDGTVEWTGEVELDREQAAEFRELVEGKSDRADWFLLRQQRQGQPESFVTLEKIETARLWEGLAEDFDAFKVNPDSGRVIPDDAETGYQVSEVVTRAVFSCEDEAALEERKGAMLVEYELRHDGETVEDEGNRQFILHNEPYWTTKYPIFVFEAAGQTLALRSDIGRHGDPSLAFPLFAEVTVDYMKDKPREALMNGKISARKPGEQFLNWFSRASEVYLTRWIYPGMFLLCAAIMAVVSVMFISMMVIPPKKLPPIPEPKEKEKSDTEAKKES